MAKSTKAVVAFMLCMLLPFSCYGETLIRIHTANGSTVMESTSIEEGFAEGSTAAYLQGLQIISQRDPRFATDAFRYVQRQSFEKNGCGPASLYNGLAAAFGIRDAETSVEVLHEVMTLLAVFHNPAEYGINYNQVENLLTPEPEEYPALAELMDQAGRIVYIGAVTASKVMKQIQKDSDDVFLMGRLCLNSDMGELVDLTDALCEAGHRDAIVVVCGVSAGASGSKTPFGQGEEGHFITYMVIAGEFSEAGTVYVLDSYPRALRNEKVNDIYISRYYFAESNYLPGFRQTYDVTRIQPTVLMCTLNETSLGEIESLCNQLANGKRVAKDIRSLRIRYANYIKTFGTGTLMVRICDEK